MIGILVLALLAVFLACWWLVRAIRVAWDSRTADEVLGACMWAGTDRPAPVSAPIGRGMVPRHGQLVFVVPLGQGMLGLDCLLEATDESEPDGLPVHLVTTLPTSPWLAEVEQGLVVRWLTTGDPVEVELSLLSSLPRVTLTCDKTTLMLPLTVS